VFPEYTIVSSREEVVENESVLLITHKKTQTEIQILKILCLHMFDAHISKS